MDYERQSKYFDDRMNGLVFSVGRVSNIPQGKLTHALLGDRWAIEAQTNGMADEDLVPWIEKYCTYCSENGVRLTAEKTSHGMPYSVIYDY